MESFFQSGRHKNDQILTQHQLVTDE